MPAKLSETTDTPSGFLNNPWFFRGLITFFVLVLLGLGVFSEPSLGDESIYYRFAKNAFLSGHRPVFDMLFPSGKPPGFYFTLDALWSLGLSLFWRVTGGISMAGAQIFHSLFFLLLLVTTYLSARKLYGAAAARWSVVILASVPMIASFGMLFYVDVPGTALAVLCFYLLLEKRYFWAGLTLGLQCLMKRTMIFFIPAIFFLIYFQNQKDRKRFFLSGLRTFLPAICLIGVDAYWRFRNFPHEYSILSQLISRWAYLTGKLRMWVHSSPEAVRQSAVYMAQFSNSSILSIKDNLCYWGLLLPLCLIFYFAGRRAEKIDLPVWLFLISYIFADLSLSVLPDIRYFLPAVPFLAILAARGIETSIAGRRWLASGILLCVLLQFTGTAAYTFQRRKVPEGVLEGLAFVRENVPAGEVVIYPEANFLEYANRPMVWCFFNLTKFFWGTDAEKKLISDESGLHYLAVRKSRIYDDAKLGRNYGGYPVSFVRWLSSSGSAKLLFDNAEISVWKLSWQG